MFEIQIESPRAVGQSIVGAGNMNLLEATPPPLLLLGPAARRAGKGAPSLHSQTFASKKIDSSHSYIQQFFFVSDQFFRPTIHDSNPDFLPIKGPATKEGVSLFPRGRKQLVNRQCSLQLLHLTGRKWVVGGFGARFIIPHTH